MSETPKLKEPRFSPVTARGFRLRAELWPNALVIAIEERRVAPKEEAHLAHWFVHATVAPWFPISRTKYDAIAGHLLDYFDPDLRGHLELLTGWMDDAAEGEAPPQPANPLTN